MKRILSDMTSLFVAPERLDACLCDRGFVLLDSAAFTGMLGTTVDKLNDWRAFWENLPADVHLRDGGRYRQRRHASFKVTGATVERVAHRAHWQPLQYNALHGGLTRWFEPIDDALTGQGLWRTLLTTVGKSVSALRGERPWYVEAHTFRIDTTDGIGRPTPEGAHRDGVDLVAVIMAGRHNIKGGESRVFDADGPCGIRFTLTEPWSILLLDDKRVIHETTPIQPLDQNIGYRDTLVLTYRAGGFLDSGEGGAA